MRKVAVGLVGVLLLVGMATGAGASVAPSVRVSPHLGLRDGREVTVRWRGMLSPERGKTTQFLQVLECNRAFTAENASDETYAQDCDEYYAQPSTHRGFWQGTVHRSNVGLASLPCTTDTCEIVVIAGHTAPSFELVIERVAIAPIEFRS
jgi:hypothetical protein